MPVRRIALERMRDSTSGRRGRGRHSEHATARPWRTAIVIPVHALIM